MKGASRALSPAYPLSLAPSSNPIGGRVYLPSFLPPDAPALPQSQVFPVGYSDPSTDSLWGYHPTYPYTTHSFGLERDAHFFLTH